MSFFSVTFLADMCHIAKKDMEENAHIDFTDERDT